LIIYNTLTFLHCGVISVKTDQISTTVAVSVKVMSKINRCLSLIQRSTKHTVETDLMTRN